MFHVSGNGTDGGDWLRDTLGIEEGEGLLLDSPWSRPVGLAVVHETPPFSLFLVPHSPLTVFGLESLLAFSLFFSEPDSSN